MAAAAAAAAALELRAWLLLSLCPGLVGFEGAVDGVEAWRGPSWRGSELSEPGGAPMNASFLFLCR